jgi:hypothetical protein
MCQISDSEIAIYAQLGAGHDASMRLHSSPGRCPGSPGPLEVESAEMPRDIDYFANEKQSRRAAAFHSLA